MALVNTSNVHTTVDDLPSDVLFLIFQEIVEEDATLVRNLFSSTRVGLPRHACARLALVSRRWRAVVYECPSLWRIFWFHLMGELEPTQKKLDNLLSLAKNTAVDLYLINIHNRNEAFSRHSLSCVCTDERFFLSLRRITNIRALSLHFRTPTEYFCFTPNALPSLENMRYFQFVSDDEEVFLNNPLKLFPLMPELVTLKTACGISGGQYDRLGNDQPLLPRLRSFELTVRGQILGKDLTTLLGHCPNLRSLLIIGSIKTDNSRLNIELRSLRILHLQNALIIPLPFIDGRIETPNLEEFKIDFEHRTTTEHWCTFFKRNPNIKRLTIPTQIDYHMLLCEAPYVQDLVVDADELTGDDWLRILADTEVESSISGLKLPICPNLRTITILFGPLLHLPAHSAFEEFTRSRCIPVRSVDGKLYTMTGYRALELLVMRLLREEETKVETLERMSWNGAEVEQVSRGETAEFRLRWSYSEPNLNDS